MIEQVEKTKDNILQIAADRGISEKMFISILKSKKIEGQFDPEKWSLYMEIITRELPCPLCGGDQRQYRELAGRWGSAGGVGCRQHRDHFFTLHIYLPLIRGEHPEWTYEQTLEWVIQNKKEVVLDAFGVSRFKEQCIEHRGKYYFGPDVVGLPTTTGSDNSII